MRTATYKAVAYEHSNGSKGYHMGTGIAFSSHSRGVQRNREGILRIVLGTQI
jgi:hypothetical protein